MGRAVVVRVVGDDGVVKVTRWPCLWSLGLGRMTVVRRLLAGVGDGFGLG